MNNTKSIGFLVGASAVLVAFTAFAGWVTQLLWNECLVSAINGVNQIGYYQALGIWVLSTILFKSVKLNNKNGK
tara:strand:- start:1673 stop:1894 length:222 start_codon:yes stop_codon:yes gene_type:complete